MEVNRQTLDLMKLYHIKTNTFASFDGSIYMADARVTKLTWCSLKVRMRQTAFIYKLYYLDLNG